MKRPVWRVFDSLFGRTVLVLILTLVLSHAAAFALFSWAFRDGPTELRAKQIVAEVETQRGIWRVLSNTERRAYLQGQDGRLSPLRESPPDSLRPVGDFEPDRHLQEVLRRLLGEEIVLGRGMPPHDGLWLRVTIGGRWLWLRHSPARWPGAGKQAAEPHPEAQQPPEWQSPGFEAGNMPPPPRPDNGFGPFGEAPGAFRNDGPPPPGANGDYPRGPQPNQFQALSLILASAAIGLLGTLALLWPLYRPLRRLSQAQAALGRGESVDRLPAQGPYEVAQLVEGFNHMKDNLDALEDDRRTLLAGVSHDLRTPLTRLRMRLALLDDIDTAPYERDLDDIEHITEQFLDYVRGQADEAPRERVQLAELLQLQAERYSHLTELSVDADPSLYALIDRLAIGRALGNLIDNALAHGGAPITLSAHQHGKEVCLTVRDHGPGMPEAALTAARRPFYRLDPARQGRGHCGLGLAIVQRVAQRHGGRLQLSNADGGGLQASLCLPPQA